jgi:pimeloyl-ACP methyl ester carboxylesterase
MHGAWCWQPLVRELEQRGHVAVAPELPCDETSAGVAEYAAVVEAMLPAGVDDACLVLVGHSLGSRTIPVVASAHPGARMVFLCSAPTRPGPVDPADFAGMVTDDYARAEVDSRSDGSTRITPERARALFYHDCDEAAAEDAALRLRFQARRPLDEASPLDRWPEAPLEIVVCDDDRVVRPDWLLAQARRWLGDRPPRRLPGGHSPMLSRPAALAELLIACAADLRGSDATRTD